MQVINLEATISTPTLEASINVPSLNVEMRTLRLGGGGTIPSYNDLPDKPKIEGVTLQGNVPISDLGLRTSDLINDSGFITTGDIPTKTSDLTNDSNFQTGAEVAASITAAIPTNVSSFTNDVGYITNADIPTNVSSFTNDAGYITSGELPSFAVDSVNGQTGDVVLTGDDIEASPYFSLSGTVGSVLANHGLQIHYLGQQIPTKTSDLTNDSGFITAAGAPVQSVNGQTGSVILKATDLAGGQAGYEDVNNAGSTIITTNAAEDIPVVYLNVAITPIQASGTPTPSDPLPITGLTDVVIDITDSDSNIHNYTISLGQTVYGGSLNVTTGELIINLAGSKISDLTWYYSSGLACFNTPSLASSVAGGNDGVLCEVEELLDSPLTTANINANDHFVRFNKSAGGTAETGNFSAGSLVLKDTDFTDVATMLAAIGDNYIVYPLETPITATLTPTEVRTYATQCTIQLTNCDIASIRFFTTGSEFLVPQVKAILEAFNLL